MMRTTKTTPVVVGAVLCHAEDHEDNPEVVDTTFSTTVLRLASRTSAVLRHAPDNHCSFTIDSFAGTLVTACFLCVAVA